MPHVYASVGEPLQVILSQRGIHDVKGLFAPLEALFYERAKHPVLFVEAVEKTTNVTLIAKYAISYVNRTFIACSRAAAALG